MSPVFHYSYSIFKVRSAFLTGLLLYHTPFRLSSVFLNFLSVFFRRGHPSLTDLFILSHFLAFVNTFFHLFSIFFASLPQSRTLMRFFGVKNRAAKSRSISPTQCVYLNSKHSARDFISRLFSKTLRPPDYARQNSRYCLSGLHLYL